MTEPSKALAELTRQHEALRAMMDRCEQLADQIDAGRADCGVLVEEVIQLRAAFDAHHRFEEEVLRPILRSLGELGDLRVEPVLADHIDEHRDLRDRLDGPTGELRATLDRLRAHLWGEERYLLASRASPARADSHSRG